jgi:hypothetical protein
MNAANGEVLLYNDIILGNAAYNQITGKFTAPLDGTYIFHFHGLAQKDKVNFTSHTLNRKTIRIHIKCPCGIREIAPSGLNISVRDEACGVPDRNFQPRG